MYAIEIDEMYPTFIEYLPPEILQEMKMNPCCRSGCRFSTDKPIMFVNLDGKIRWWHFREWNAPVPCKPISKEYEDEPIPTETYPISADDNTDVT